METVNIEYINNVVDRPKRHTISTCITRSGAFINYSDLPDKTLTKRIDLFFTINTKTFTGQTRQLKTHRNDRNKQRFIVPRFGLRDLSNKCKANFTSTSQIKPGRPIELEYCGRPSHNQKIVARSIFSDYFDEDNVDAGTAGVIVNLAAGQGKSYLATYVISKLLVKTAIILHSTSMIEQWEAVINKSFSNAQIGYYYCNKKKDGDIVLMIVKSAANTEFKKDNELVSALSFYRDFGLIIFDECHLYCNKENIKALRNANATYMLGLSATPDENSVLDRIANWHIGPVLTASDLPGYSTTTEEYTAIVHRVMYYGGPDYTKVIVNEAFNLVDCASTINMLCRDDARKRVIIDCIMQGIGLGLYIFVFADRREYLLELREMLVDVASDVMTNDNDYMRIVGGTSTEDLANAEQNARVIFTTYQFMGTGKSIVKMNGLVLTTPRRSKMKQYINRIFRLGSDQTITRHIWDICDMRTSLSSQWSTRKKYYTSKSYTITQSKIMYTDI